MIPTKAANMETEKSTSSDENDDKFPVEPDFGDAEVSKRKLNDAEVSERKIAHDTGSLAIALAFATITALALSALYESVQVLEDPFVAFLTLDGIDVYEELAVLYYHQLVETRRYIFPDAPEFIEFDGEDGSDDAEEDDGPPATLIGRRSMLSNNKHGMVSSRKMVEGAPQIDRCSSLKNMDRSSVFEMSVPPTDRRASLRTMNRKSVFSMDLPDSRRRPSRILQNREKPDLRRQSVHNN